MKGCIAVLSLLSAAASLPALEGFEADSFATAGGTLIIHFVGHGTLMLEYGGKVIHVDPVSREADYTKMPKADLILITHAHSDHLDPKAIEQIRRSSTRIVANQESAVKVRDCTALKNGQTLSILGISIEALPAYNTSKDRERFHPPGRGNGYLLTFADKRVYVAGDTENHPQMMGLRNIDIAFLPMNLPYTMSPEQVAEAARAMRPKILYPYHFGDSDTARLVELLKDVAEVEVRIRELD